MLNNIEKMTIDEAIEALAEFKGKVKGWRNIVSGNKEDIIGVVDYAIALTKIIAKEGGV